MPSKDELCELANSLKPCLQNHVEHSCTHPITREAFIGMYDAITAPCGKMSQNGNRSDDVNLNEIEVLE